MFDANVFWSEIRAETARANELVSHLEELAASGIGGERFDFTRHQLSHFIGRLRLRTLLACDVLAAASFRDEFERGWLPYQADPTKLQLAPWIGALICPALDYLSNSLAAFSPLLPKGDAPLYGDDQRLRLLDQILEGTPKLLADRGLLPNNEADVRREIYNVLLHVFPDTVREIPILQPSKAYRPDIGVRSLKAAVEYKFVDSAESAKTCLGAIYEDIHGYSGSADWSTFYAVIYMTDQFLTRHQVEAEWRMTGVPHTWRPILVTGRGHRLPKRQRPTFEPAPGRANKRLQPSARRKGMTRRG